MIPLAGRIFTIDGGVVLLRNAFHVCEAEDRALHRRLAGKGPGASAVVGSGGIDGRVVCKIAAPYDAVPGIAESHRQPTGAWRTHEGRVIGVPGVATVASREDTRDGRATGGDPGVSSSLRRDTGPAGRK